MKIACLSLKKAVPSSAYPILEPGKMRKYGEKVGKYRMKPRLKKIGDGKTQETIGSIAKIGKMRKMERYATLA